VKKIDLKDEKTRTIALGVAAGLMVTIFVVKSMIGGAPEEVPAARDHTKKNAATAEVKAAVIEHDYAKLKTYYRPIVDAEPFKAHAFLPKALRGTRPPPSIASDTSATPPGGPPPGSSTLRLTGIFAVDTSGLTGWFENRGANKGLFVHKGDVLGPREVAEVRTDSVLFATVAATGTESAVAPIQSTILILGDALYVPTKDIELKWQNIGPVMSTTMTAPPPPVNGNTWASKNTVPLTDNERESVLDRLKKKRRASLGGEAPK
jgi:hypothetical protein